MGWEWVDNDIGGEWQYVSEDLVDTGAGTGYTASDYLNDPSVGQNYDWTKANIYDPGTDPSSPSYKGGADLFGSFKSMFMKPDGSLDWNAIKLAGGLGGAVLGATMASSKGSTGKGPIGYQGSIPKYTATRTQIAPPASGGIGSLGAETKPANPYAVGDTMGRQHFTDVVYTKKAPDVPAAPAELGIGSLQAKDTLASDLSGFGPLSGGAAPTDLVGPVKQAANGGLMGLAAGGSTGEPRYLAGGTDGMADELHASIDDKQPAKLSHGEFVIPADVVGHLGNGNSEAGAKRLYEMMARIRKARTGNPEQGKRINPNKFLPS